MRQLDFLFICLAAVIISNMVLFYMDKEDGLTIKKYDDCVALANEVGFDPNDDERSNFIMNCFEDR